VAAVAGSQPWALAYFQMGRANINAIWQAILTHESLSNRKTRLQLRDSTPALLSNEAPWPAKENLPPKFHAQLKKDFGKVWAKSWRIT
jgi:hypothetical protein